MREPANPKWDQVTVGALARKAKLPRYYYDTTSGRDALGRFAEAVLEREKYLRDISPKGTDR